MKPKSGCWDSTQIATFNEWLQSNVSKLVLGLEHTIAEYCAKHKKDINDFVSFKQCGDSPVV